MRHLVLNLVACATASLLALGCASCNDASQSSDGGTQDDGSGSDSTNAVDGPGSGSAGWTQKGGTLSMDPQGWAYNATLASSPDGTLYAAWTQHRKADVDEIVSPRVARWTGTAWQSLGDRIAHAGHSGFTPVLAFVGDTPYLAWSEGDGYGWSTAAYVSYGASIFVAHWDGTGWAEDPDSALGNGSLHTSTTVSSREPRLAVVGGRLYAAWIENRAGDYPADGYNVVLVKHLDAGGWTQDATELRSLTYNGSRITDLAVADVNGSLVVVFCEYQRQYAAPGVANLPGTVRVYQLSSGAWTPMGGALNISSENYPNHVALTVLGTAPYVAWQERSATGNLQLYVKHWDGAAWVQDGASLNVDPVQGEAGRPALASDRSKVWLAWAEGAPGQPSQLYVRPLDGATWGAPEGSLNLDWAKGSVDRAALAIRAGAPQVLWGEYDVTSRARQVYLKGRDQEGTSTGTPAGVARFGSDGTAPVIADNTWVSLHPGGIVSASWPYLVNDEAYNSFVYDPGINRALAYARYHVPYIEDQNALLAYDFQTNRWDIWEAGQYAWSEHLPGVGHDEGNVVIDTLHDLYITHGNLTVGGGTRYQSYVYDLKAHRGKRMMPPTDLSGPRVDQMAAAFDPDRDQVLFFSSGAWLYDHASNAWTSVPNSPPARGSAALVYDRKKHVYVMFGGGLTYAAPSSTETWIFDPATKVWVQQFPAAHPASGTYPAYPFMAYDSVNGVTLLVGGGTLAVWVYDAGANTWTPLADAPSGLPVNQVDGAYMVYDSVDRVFLVRDAGDLSNLWAFRYVP